MTPIQQTLDQAIKFHQTGNLKQAERYYRYILQRDPQHVEALHLFGVLCHQTGRSDLAIAHFGEAIRLKPDLAEAHHNLGCVLGQQGRLDEAIVSLRQALQFNPHYAEALNSLGNAFRGQNKLDEASAALKQCLRIRPQFAEAHHNLGLVYQQQGKLDDAAECFREASRCKPDLAEVHASSQQAQAPIVVEIAAGELIDKITILHIKSERLTDPAKLAHVRTELEALRTVRGRALPSSAELDALTAELKAVNETLWQIEDDIRQCERAQDFGPRFIELARSVYHRNDLRAVLKRRIDELLGSRFVEEKSYASYKNDKVTG